MLALVAKTISQINYITDCYNVFQAYKLQLRALNMMLLVSLYFYIMVVLPVFTSRMRSARAAFGLVYDYWEEKSGSVYSRRLMLQSIEELKCALCKCTDSV